VLVGTLAVLPFRLDHGRQVLEPSVPEEDRKAVADQPLAQVRVTVPIRAERRLRVVHVQRA